MQLALCNSNPKEEKFFFELYRDSNSRKSLLFEFSSLKGENSKEIGIFEKLRKIVKVKNKKE